MNKPIAKCYLLEDGDESNVCFLTDETFTIVYKARKSTFFNHWIKAIFFKNKVYLMPIVFGGIAAPLAGLGLFQYYLNPWFMLSLLFAALLSIYYGIMGGTALTIETPIKEYDFFVPKASDNMLAFSSFVNSIINENSILFYIMLSNEQFQSIDKSGSIKLPKAGITLEQTKPKKIDGMMRFKLDSKNIPFEIKYIETKSGLKPKVFNSIPLSTLVAIDHND